MTLGTKYPGSLNLIENWQCWNLFEILGNINYFNRNKVYINNYSLYCLQLMTLLALRYCLWNI